MKIFISISFVLLPSTAVASDMGGLILVATIPVSAIALLVSLFVSFISKTTRGYYLILPLLIPSGLFSLLAIDFCLDGYGYCDKHLYYIQIAITVLMLLPLVVFRKRLLRIAHNK